MKPITWKSVKIENQCIDIYSVNAAAHAAQFELTLRDETEKLLRANNIIVRPNSASHTHLRFFHTTNTARKMSRGAIAAVATTREIRKRYTEIARKSIDSVVLFTNNYRFGLTFEQAAHGLQNFNLRDTILSDTCPVDPVCDGNTARSPFRTFDGSCNNLKKSFWGKSNTHFQRYLNPQYADGNSHDSRDVVRKRNSMKKNSNFLSFIVSGVWQPRRSISGNQLPR